MGKHLFLILKFVPKSSKKCDITHSDITNDVILQELTVFRFLIFGQPFSKFRIDIKYRYAYNITLKVLSLYIVIFK